DLADESFGISLQFKEQMQLEDFEGEIFRYINAGWRHDFSVGNKYIKLVRGDFDVESLPTLDEDDIASVQSYKTTTLSEIVTTVEVVYTDRDSDYKEKPVRSPNMGARLNLGRERVKRLNYPGVFDNDVAASIADREAAGFSRASRTMSIKTANRRPAEWDWGDTLKIADDVRFPGQVMIMDILEKNEGKLQDAAHMILKLAENRFAFQSATYSSNSASTSAALSNAPAAVAVQYLLEAPRWFCADDDALHRLFAFAKAPTS